MAPHDSDKYFRLVALIVDIAFNVISKYIKERILESDSFETFLKKERHKLVHMYETSKCCECNSEEVTKERLISRKQLLVLFQSDEMKQIPSHKIGKPTKICICNYSVKTNISVSVVDISLANYIIQKYGKNELGIANWIEQIKDVRNTVVHLSDIKDITDDEFITKWSKVEGSILGIAEVISKKYAVEIQNTILETKELTVIPDYMFKYQKLCCDYWKNKCAEFEKAQRIEEKAATLNVKLQQLEHTLKRLVDNTNILINIYGGVGIRERFELEEDMQRVHMPAFLELEVPSSWNKSKVLKAIDEIRLRKTRDMKIRIKAISTDDLNIISEIEKTLLCNMEEVGDEIKKMMSWILSEAGINTAHHAEVGVNLKFQDITGQLELRSQTYNFEDVELSLLRKFRFNGKTTPLTVHPSISDCAIIGGKLALFLDYNGKNIIINNDDGSYNKDINLIDKPWCISVINDSEIAVSYRKPYIELIDISTGHVFNKIATSDGTDAISSQYGMIYALINNNIVVLSMTGEDNHSFPCPSLSVRFIKTEAGKLFLTDPVIYTVYCCDLHGLVLWTFTGDAIQIPWGVTTDKNGYVYVTCEGPKTVIVISPDGKRHKPLLTEKDKVWNLKGICFDETNDRLLVCSARTGCAYLYDVQYSNT